MDTNKFVQLNIVIPEHFRDQLRRMAAERILENPGHVESGASIAQELLLKVLNEIEAKNHARSKRNDDKC